MKKNIFIIAGIFLAISNLLYGQQFDLKLTDTQIGDKTHVARNSITFGPNFTYTPNGGTLTAEIQNPIVTGDISYSAFTDPETRSLNTSHATGTTQGAFSVSPIGGASYSIPIDLPPGVGGLQPSLSLVYNSMAGPGVAGYGWGLSGLSAIARTGKNYYNDGTASGVNLDFNDKLVLDGQRLICTNGYSYGTSGSQYRTENDIFTRITCYADNYGPTNFMGETKNGLIFRYGYDDDADQTLDGFTERVAWYVDKVTDVYGNEINFEYFRDNGQVYIGEITYGPNVITFYYKNRTDKTNSYLKGAKIENNVLLEKIEIKYNSNQVKKYEFVYNYPNASYNQNSVLNEIVEFGTGTTRLNSTCFSYQTPDEVNFVQTIYNTTNDYISYKSLLVSGDFNGDGKGDFFCLPRPGLASWTGMRIYLGDGYDNFTLYASSANSIDINTLQDINAIDINANGIDDIVFERLSGSTSLYYSINISAQGTIGASVYIISLSNSTSETGISGKKRRKANKQENDNELNGADYNGDGIQDIFINNGSGEWRICSQGNGTGQILSNVYILASGTQSGLNGQVLSGDFNGDGKSDIWSFNSSGVKIYTFTGSSLLELYTSTWPSSSHHFSLADFNGDGKTDVFLYGYSTYDWTEWQMQLSTGNGFENKIITQKKSNLKNDYVRLGDFNGDGLIDIMATSANNSWQGSYFFINKNYSTDFHTQMLNGYPAATHGYSVADYDGDGRTDFLCVDGEQPWWNGYQLYRSGSKNKRLIEKIANGLNALTKVQYKTQSQNNTPYTKDTPGNAIFPVSDFQEPIPIVSSVIYENGTGSQNTQNYAYTGAKVHLQGKGFLCYKKQTVTELTSGILTENNFSYDLSLFYPKLNSSYSKSNGITLSSVSNSWSHLNPVTGVIMPYISSSTESNNLTGLSVSQSFTYDNSNGNLTQTVKNFNNGYTETVSNQFDGNTTYNWIGGRLQNSTVTHAKTGETSIARTTSYTYSTDGKLKPDFVKYLEGTNWYVYKNYDYNTQGNITQEYAYSSNGGERQTNYTYESNNIRVKTITDPLGQTTTNNYDTYGRLSSQVDYLNLTTSFTYDNMGRNLTETSPDGYITTTSFNWGINNFNNSCYYIQQSGNDGSLAKTWFDKLGREIRSDIRGFSGSDIYTVTEYNNKGQVYRVSDPSSSSTPSAWTTNGYDNYGRITGITRPTGQNTTYSYSSNRITETTGLRTSWKETSSMGLVTTAHDDGGDISYTYYPDGAVKSIAAPGNAVTSMEYDIAGNQTKLVDPSAGTITYSYNAYGQLLATTNGRNQQTSVNYLGDGRINTKTMPEGTESYSYNGNKQLTGISNSTTSVSRGFSYDTKGRITTITETIPGNTAFSTTFAYDGYGREQSKTHPSGIVETMAYNSNGYLSSVSAGGATRWTANAINSFGQVTQATYGASLVGEFGYDQYGIPTHQKARVGSTYRQDYRTAFNGTTGNLGSRQNYLLSKSESFGYDTGLDRLTTVTGPQNLTMQYAANGNLTAKNPGGISLYKYENSTKPYQTTGIETPVTSPQLVSDDPQTISYTSFEQPSSITESTYQALFTYNPDGQRARMEVKQNGSTILTRWYSGGSYIKESNGKEYTWIGGDAYSAPCLAVKQGTTTTWYYLLRDHLGSVTHVTDASGNVVNEYSFDAWGRRRNFTDWGYTVAAQTDILPDRGFTSHEYLPWFKLYNMNGRLYDPVTSRFLSPDENIQLPGFTQNYNRYSYCLNNPLKFNDPTGEKINWPKFTWFNAIPIIGQFDYTIEFINANTGGLRQKMVNAGIPEMSFGTNISFGGNVNLTGSYRGQEVFNTGNIDRVNPKVVYDEINGVRQAYGGMWAIAGASTISTEIAVTGSFYAAMSSALVVAMPFALTGDTDVRGKRIWIYRGVASNHPDYLNALNGIATPIGGHNDPILHNKGNTRSVFTSWTFDENIANWYAQKGGFRGVVLVYHANFTRLVPSPDFFNQAEVLIPGIVTGAKVKYPKGNGYPNRNRR